MATAVHRCHHLYPSQPEAPLPTVKERREGVCVSACEQMGMRIADIQWNPSVQVLRSSPRGGVGSLTSPLAVSLALF